MLGGVAKRRSSSSVGSAPEVEFGPVESDEYDEVNGDDAAVEAADDAEVVVMVEDVDAGELLVELIEDADPGRVAEIKWPAAQGGAVLTAAVEAVPGNGASDNDDDDIRDGPGADAGGVGAPT